MYVIYNVVLVLIFLNRGVSTKRTVCTFSNYSIYGSSYRLVLYKYNFSRISLHLSSRRNGMYACIYYDIRFLLGSNLKWIVKDGIIHSISDRGYKGAVGELGRSKRRDKKLYKRHRRKAHTCSVPNDYTLTKEVSQESYTVCASMETRYCVFSTIGIVDFPRQEYPWKEQHSFVRLKNIQII